MFTDRGSRRVASRRWSGVTAHTTSNRLEFGLNVILDPSPGPSRTTAAITHPDRRPFGPTPKEPAPEADGAAGRQSGADRTTPIVQ